MLLKINTHCIIYRRIWFLWVFLVHWQENAFSPILLVSSLSCLYLMHHCHWSYCSFCFISLLEPSAGQKISWNERLSHYSVIFTRALMSLLCESIYNTEKLFLKNFFLHQGNIFQNVKTLKIFRWSEFWLKWTGLVWILLNIQSHIGICD